MENEQNEKTEEVKRGRGRPAGSVSYIGVKLLDLIHIFREDSTILVDKSYCVVLKMNGLSYIKLTREQVQKIQDENDCSPVLVKEYDFDKTDFVETSE